MRRIWLFLTWLFLMAFQAGVDSVVTITLLDPAGLPVEGATVTLTLFAYTEWIEALPAGSCTTDATGSCRLALSGVPRLANGRAEGQLTLSGFSYQPVIGWTGAAAAFVFQASDLELAATYAVAAVSPGEGSGYAGQQRTPTPGAVTPSAPSRPGLPPATATLTPEVVQAAQEFWDVTGWLVGLVGLVGLLVYFFQRRTGGRRD